MKSIDDGSIDLVVTDPPYMTTDLRFDKEATDFDLIAKEIKRVLKPTGWAFVFLPVELTRFFLSNGFNLKFEYVWIKTKGTMQTYNTVKPMSRHEKCYAFVHKELKKANDLTFNKKDIMTTGHSSYVKTNKASTVLTEYEKSNRIVGYKKDVTRINTGSRMPTTVLFAPSKDCMKKSERTKHPTQKPLHVINTIIKGYSNKNDLVLDPFAGSGTTGIACVNHYRYYILIEKNKEYFQEAFERIEKEKELGGMLFT